MPMGSRLLPSSRSLSTAPSSTVTAPRGDPSSGYLFTRASLGGAVLNATIADLSLSRKVSVFDHEIGTTLRVQNLFDKRYYGTRQIYGDPRQFVLELRRYF